MRSLEIYWNDLTDEAKERLHLLNHENVDMSPIAIIDIEVEDDMFRNLTLSEVVEFRAWARKNYEPNGNISELWHPVIKDECNKINKETNAK